MYTSLLLQTLLTKCPDEGENNDWGNIRGCTNESKLCKTTLAKNSTTLGKYPRKLAKKPTVR